MTAKVWRRFVRTHPQPATNPAPFSEISRIAADLPDGSEPRTLLDDIKTSLLAALTYDALVHGPRPSGNGTSRCRCGTSTFTSTPASCCASTTSEARCNPLRRSTRRTSTTNAPSLWRSTPLASGSRRRLSDLLNRYTFAYPGSPLRRLTISIEKGRIKQQGTMRGISFTTLSDLTLTPVGSSGCIPSPSRLPGSASAD